MTMPTLLDIAKQNGSDAVAGLIEETSKASPEITLGFARTIKGLNYKTLVRTGLPTVGFRNANEGYAASKATYENRLVETYIFNPRWECDRAVADHHEDGAAAFIALEAAAIMEAAFQALGSQFYYGTSSDSKGFPGLEAAVDTTNMVVDATGTTSNTGSSVWAVKFGPKDVAWVWGQAGQLSMEDPTIERLLDGSSNPYSAYCQELLAYPGLQVGNTRCIGKIKNLTEDSGKGLTDNLIYSLLSKFQVGVKPDMLLMNRRSLKQLRQSRTATSPTGSPAPIPTEIEGIPIHLTDSILSTEAIA